VTAKRSEEAAHQTASLGRLQHKVEGGLKDKHDHFLSLDMAPARVETYFFHSRETTNFIFRQHFCFCGYFRENIKTLHFREKFPPVTFTRIM
jgi:hypothetical protein